MNNVAGALIGYTFSFYACCPPSRFRRPVEVAIGVADSSSERKIFYAVYLLRAAVNQTLSE